MYCIHSDTPYIDINTKTIEELNKELSYLNPLLLHYANQILKKQYQLIACGLGPDIECIPYVPKSINSCEISIVCIKA